MHRTLSSLQNTLGIVSHGFLIGAMLGLSTNPVVGVAVPLLLGVGGYKFLERSWSMRTEEPGAQGLGGISGLALGAWSISILVALVIAIGVRQTGLPWLARTDHNSVVTYVDLQKIPPQLR